MRSDRKAAALAALRELECLCVHPWAWKAYRFVQSTIAEEGEVTPSRVTDYACPQCGFSAKHHKLLGLLLPNGEWCSMSDAEIYRTYAEIEHAECEQLRAVAEIDRSTIQAMREHMEKIAAQWSKSLAAP